MTRKEIEKAFPIGSRVVREESVFHSELKGCFAKIIGYYAPVSSDGTWLLELKWETKVMSAFKSWDPCNFTLVQEPQPNHDGMLYNPVTGKWSWF